MEGHRWAGAIIALAVFGLFIAGAFFLWNGGEELATLRGHTAVVRSLAFSPDGHSLVSVGDDHTLRLWDLPSRHLVRTVEVGNRITRVVTIARDGAISSAGDDKVIRLWTNSGDSQGEIVADASIEALAFSPDGSSIAFGTTKGEVQLWSMPGRSLVRKLKSSDQHIHGVAFAPDGSHMVSASEHGLIDLWNVSTGSKLASMNVGRRHVHGIAYSPDGSTIAAAVGGRGVCWWMSPEMRELPSIEGACLVLSLAFSPDGKYIATSHEDGTLHVWNIADGSLKKKMTGHRGPVMAVAFSPDCSTVASAGSDHTIKLWRVPVNSEH